MARLIHENLIPMIYFSSDGFPFCATCADEQDAMFKTKKSAIYITASDLWDEMCPRKCFICKRHFVNLPGVSIVACDNREKAKRAERNK